MTNERAAVPPLNEGRAHHGDAHPYGSAFLRPTHTDEIERLSGTGSWEWDVANSTIAWSRQTRRIFELKEDSPLTPADIANFRDAEGEVAERDAIRTALRDGEPWDVEYFGRTATGRRILLRSTGHADRIDGRTTRIFGIIQDITSSRAAEAALKRSEAFASEISDLALIGGWEFELATSRTTWSAMTRRIYEMDEAYVPLAEDQKNFVVPEYIPAVDAAIREAIVTGNKVTIELQALTGKGRRIWIRNICRPERVNGRTVRLVGTAQDITAQKSAQARLNALNIRLEAALEAAELSVWEVDVASGEMRWSTNAPPSFANAEMGNRANAYSALDFIHPADRGALKSQARLVALTDQASTNRVRVFAPEGGLRDVEVRMRLAPDFDAAPAILGISRDITREVALNSELASKRDEAEAASVAKSEFLARMSHEIRTPLTGVIGMLDVLVRTEGAPERRNQTETALRAARDLMHVLDDVIDISQLASHHMAIQYRPFQVVDLVHGVVELFADRAESKSLTLAADVSTDVPAWLLGDGHRLRQVIANLVNNALKFTDEGQITIGVGYAVGQAELRIEVTDTGKGISADQLGSLFQPFFQVDTSATRKHGGSGLGLSICKEIVEKMGGTIGVESDIGRGTRVWFAVRADLSAAPELVHIDPPTEQKVSPLRILIAEDNEATQKILTALLIPEGHVLKIVADGQGAVAAATAEQFDVILMDVMMPVMDGPTATRRIRELSGAASRVPILALTANVTKGARELYLAAGMTDYLTKPIDIPALFAALAKVAPDTLHNRRQP